MPRSTYTIIDANLFSDDLSTILASASGIELDVAALIEADVSAFADVISTATRIFRGIFSRLGDDAPELVIGTTCAGGFARYFGGRAVNLW